MQFLHPVEYDSAVYYCSDNTAHFNVVWKNLRYSVEETRTYYINKKRTYYINLFVES